MDDKRRENTALVSPSMGRLIPVASLSTILAFAIVIFMIYAFFSGITMQFYASFLFLFYSWVGHMWVAVICLGIFQTLLMVPFRMINLSKSQSLDHFKETAQQLATEKDQYFLKKQFKKGGNVALYYVVNFVVALVSYITIGRLFLTDFYSVPLDPKHLYSFVTYPAYPIADRIFKIPYTWFTTTHDFGVHAVYWAWGGLLFLQLAIYIGLYFAKRRKALTPQFSKTVTRFTTGNLLLLMALSWWLMRHFPTGWQGFLFTGDVGLPNQRLNSITAIATFITLVWTNLPKIRIQIETAEAAGYDKKVIQQTQKELLEETFKVASVVGLGAYFITNLIPSAFELSIFTLEIISWVSPLTLDRLILGGMKAKQAEEKGEDKVVSVPV